MTLPAVLCLLTLTIGFAGARLTISRFRHFRLSCVLAVLAMGLGFVAATDFRWTGGMPFLVLAIVVFAQGKLEGNALGEPAIRSPNE